MLTQSKKNLLVLGGTSDIGIAVAKKFAQEKFNVILAGRDLEYLDRIARDIMIREHTQVTAVAFDALCMDCHASFYASLGVRPDVCVCVFGYLGDQETAAFQWNESERIIDTNFKAGVSILNVIAGDFEKAGHGTIIGISSVAGDRGRQSNYIYGSAKAAFSAYLSGLRNRLFRKGVRVITIKPGFVDTRMTEGLKLPRLLTATRAQVADAVYNAWAKARDVVYVLAIWRLVMLVIRLTPEFVFKRLKL